MDGNANVAAGPVMPQVGSSPAANADPAALAAVAANMVANKKRTSSIIETVVLVVVSLIAATAIVFAVYFYLQWNEAQTNVDGKIAEAEAIAREDQQRIAEENFAEREKQPNLQFTGPSDYGSLNFKYPRTWSVYVAKDASQGGDFEAYFNPGQVNAVGTSTINALRFSIINQSIDTVRTQYDSLVKSGKLTHSVIKVGTIEAVDRYEGEFNADITGMMIMFKIPNYPQTAVLRADAMIFQTDFDALIQTITTR